MSKARGTKKTPATQKQLPGVDQEIEELQSKAVEYAAIRDERQALTQREVDLKKDLLALMKKHKKTKYNRGGVSIEIVTEEESVKVRIKKQKEADE